MRKPRNTYEAWQRMCVQNAIVFCLSIFTIFTDIKITLYNLQWSEIEIR